VVHLGNAVGSFVRLKVQLSFFNKSNVTRWPTKDPNSLERWAGTTDVGKLFKIWRGCFVLGLAGKTCNLGSDGKCL